MMLRNMIIRNNRKRIPISFSRNSNVLAFKEGILIAARASLFVMPIVWYFKLHTKYRRTTHWFVKVPVVLGCLALAIGLNQSPETGRWRLLWMTENEELEWSRNRIESLLLEDDNLRILDENDDRVKLVKKVTRNLVKALHPRDRRTLFQPWPDPITHGISSLIDRRNIPKPSACTDVNYSLVNFPDGLSISHPSIKSNWNIYVIEDSQVNALALPSKEIIVYTGLLTLVQKEEFLATVLAHEIAHVTQKHAIENLGFLNLATMSFEFLRGLIVSVTIPFPILTSSLTLAINWLNEPLSESAFSRKLELEADIVGLDLMARAGYNPKYSLELWSLMSGLEADSEEKKPLFEKLFPFLNTHPPSVYRLSQLQKHMQTAVKIYNTNKNIVI